MSIVGRILSTVLLSLAFGGAAASQDVRISEELPFLEMTINGANVLIERNQDPDNAITGDFAKTSRACPPFCIHPMKAAEGVETFGEMEVLSFLEEKVQAGEGLLIDARIAEWHRKGTIPSSINLPFNLVDPEGNPYFARILIALGARETSAGWDFSEAKELCLFCNGPWCDQSPQAIQNLIEAGYPAEKLKYYRGGMQMWLLLGLSATVPES